MIVVSDASPLNVLIRIGHVNALASLFGSIIVPPAVAAELSHTSTPAVVRSWMAAPPDWLQIRTPQALDATLQIDDRGEAEAISLALELRAELLLADDKKARRIARERGIPVTGAIGVLELAAARKLLDLEHAFRQIRQTDFKVAGHILEQALRRRKPNHHRP